MVKNELGKSLLCLPGENSPGEDTVLGDVAAVFRESINTKLHVLRVDDAIDGKNLPL